MTHFMNSVHCRSRWSKVKGAALFLMIELMIMTLPVVVLAEESNELYELEFNAFAAGKCFVGLTGMTFIPGPPYYTLEVLFDGSGTGIGGMHGGGEAVSIDTSTIPGPPLDLLGDYIYSAESLSAQGFASVSWKDDDNVRHWLFVSIDLTEPPISHLFEPDNDVFWMPMPGDPSLMQLLSFDAIHMSRLGVERISGMALFAVMPFPFEPGTTVLHDPAVVLFLAWMDEEVGIQYQYSILWSSETREITRLIPFDPFDITAARIFTSTVEVDD